MPAPSEWAMRLADDLVEVGKALGFAARKEAHPSESSTLRIDVVWHIIVKSTSSASPIPEEIVIVSIEIQYSDSPASISHGLVKGLYANSPYHIIVSYNALTEDFRESLRIAKPKGLVIIDGNDFVNFQLWINYVLTKQSKLADRGRKTLEQVKQVVLTRPVDMTEKLREALKEDVTLMFTPKRIEELFGSLDITLTQDSSLVERSLTSTIGYIMNLLKALELPIGIRIPFEKYVNDTLVPHDGYKFDTGHLGIYANNIFYFDEARKFNVSIKGRHIIVRYEQNPDFGFKLTLTTTSVKLLIQEAMEKTAQIVKQYEINPEDQKELTLTIDMINSLFTKFKG